MAIDRQDLHVESPGPLRHGAANRSVTDHAHRQPAHLPARAVKLSPCPTTFALSLNTLRDVPGQGEEEGEGVLSNRRTVRAARVRQDDVVLDQLRQVLQIV